jgi:Phosphoglycerate dehydrogenase and related dehydrogenases
MKIAQLCNWKGTYKRVFGDRLKNFGDLTPVVSYKETEKYREELKDCEIAFSTWGMARYTEEEIRTYFPSLKALFYAAGTVQKFARPFLNLGVKVFSAYAANAVPVAEFTAAQIILAAKGYFLAAKNYKRLLAFSFVHSRRANGNYDVKIGLIGLGAIGGMVAERLKGLRAEVYAYDPFCDGERAKALGVRLSDLETVFGECDIVSNHLANKKELKNILNYRLFKLMKKNAVFINTGRGAQVSERGLWRALIFHPHRTALIDVIKSDYFPYVSPLFWLPNIVMTPHIAGSNGAEVGRMADYMAAECVRYLAGEKTDYEITLEKLEKMA